MSHWPLMEAPAVRAPVVVSQKAGSHGDGKKWQLYHKTNSGTSNLDDVDVESQFRLWKRGHNDIGCKTDEVKDWLKVNWRIEAGLLPCCLK